MCSRSATAAAADCSRRCGLSSSCADVADRGRRPGGHAGRGPAAPAPRRESRARRARTPSTHRPSTPVRGIAAPARPLDGADRLARDAASATDPSPAVTVAAVYARALAGPCAGTAAWPRREDRTPRTGVKRSGDAARSHLVERDPRGDAGVERLRGRARSGCRRSRRRSRGPAGTGPCPRSRRRAPAGRCAGRARRARCRRRRPGRRRSTPALRYASSARVRLVARATGTRAAAPADVLPRGRVMPAARRSGTTHAVRAERGRRPDDRAEVARVGDAVERDDQRRRRRRPPRAASRSSGCAYSYGGTCSARPWWMRRRR